MGKFLHDLMEGLRGREKFLEDKIGTTPAESKDDDSFMAEYKSLQDEVDAFKQRIEDLQAKGEDYDEHFERKIKDDHHRLEVRIDSWAKSYD